MNAGVSYNFTTGQFGANAGVNAAQGSQSRAWVETPSGIVTDRDLTVTAGGHTQVTGGVIGSRSGGLTLETETLGTQDLILHETNQHVSGGVNVSVGVSKKGDVTPGGSLEGSYANAEREGIAKATIGQGTIVVRDGDGNGVTGAKLRAEAGAAEASGDPATAAALRKQADAEEASDKAATDTQLASINRDLDTVIEVTRETEEGFDLYVSDTSVKAALEAGKTVKEIIGNVLDQLAADNRLSIEDARAAKLITAHADDPEVLAQLAACGQQRGDARPSLFDWLIPPAYAAMSCEISIGGEMVIIPPDVALTCLQIVQRVRDAATVAVAATALLAGGFWLASTRETGGAIDETQTLADGTVVRLTGYGSDRIRTITATSPDGVVSVLEVEATGYGYTLIGGAVDGKPMTPGQLRSAARQASGGEVQVVYNDAPGKGQGSQTGAAAGGAPGGPEDEKPGEKGKSPNQLNKDIRQGKAPKEVERVDVGKIKGEQVHVHLKDGSALNKDGTWKHGGTTLSRATQKWLIENGWTLPK